MLPARFAPYSCAGTTVHGSLPRVKQRTAD